MSDQDTNREFHFPQTTVGGDNKTGQFYTITATGEIKFSDRPTLAAELNILTVEESEFRKLTEAIQKFRNALEEISQAIQKFRNALEEISQLSEDAELASATAIAKKTLMDL